MSIPSKTVPGSAEGEAHSFSRGLPELTAALNRRRFLARAGTSALAFTALAPNLMHAADPALELGLIGCGGRGIWLAGLFQKHGGYHIAAVADYFPDKTDPAGDKLGVPATRRYSGLLGYRRLLESKVDAVAIVSPPYFHPEQASATVEAGKHVYLAKPIAVDVPGCQTIAQAGAQASSQKRVFLVDFQTRATAAYQEVIKRVQAGEIGPIKSAEASYLCDLFFEKMDAEFRNSSKDAGARLRAWAVDRVLSGDIITEQNIHALDVATWFLNAEPLKAVGLGGRARPFQGDCWDHFAVLFTFPNEVILTFNSKQFGAAYNDIMCRVYGLTGSAETHYGGKIWMRGPEEFFNGDTNAIYETGAATNISTFHQSISQGECSNPTVAPSVRSNLTTILGRTAAYRQREVTWTDLIKAGEKLEFDTRGLKS